MDAGSVLINQVFSNRLLEVPYYQRAYVWGTEQWDKFLEDMEYITKTNRSYFLGSIILKKGTDLGTSSPFSDHRMIIDGQQRLTTLTIYMRVFCMKTNQLGLFNWNFCSYSGQVCMMHSKYDADAYAKVMAQTAAEPITSHEPVPQIIKAYNYFLEKLNPEKVNWDIIMKNVRFVTIDLAEDEDEQQIFDTINSAGVRLTTSELLKNYFFSRENVDEYDSTWVQVFEKDDDIRHYWDQDIENGREKRAMIDLFFDAYFQQFIQNRKYAVSTEDKLVYSRVERLSKSYQEFINYYCDGNKQTILGNLAAYANCFAENLRPECCRQNIPAKPCMERLNVVIFGLKNTALLPYVLYVLMNVPDEEERNRIFGILESYIMRRMVVHAPISGNTYYQFTALIQNETKDAKSLAERLGNSVSTTTFIPTDEELHSGFQNSRLINLQSKGILYLLESAMRPQNSGLKMLGFEQYSLEHMMPKKWRNKWEPCETQEAARIRDNKLLTLGNLAIITKQLNSSISDASWSVKKAGKNGKEGLDNCADGLLTMQEVLKKDTWTEADIDERAQWLYEKAKDIWHIDGIPVPAAKTVKQESTVDSSPTIKAQGKLTARQQLYVEFWKYALPRLKAMNNGESPFKGCLGSKSCYLYGYFGMNGFSLSLDAKPKNAAITLCMETFSRETNKAAYDYVYTQKEKVEAAAGTELAWWRFEGKASYICIYDEKFSVLRKSDWDAMIDYLIKWSQKFYDVIVPILREWKKNYHPEKNEK